MRHKQTKRMVAIMLILSFLVTGYGNITTAKAKGETKKKVNKETIVRKTENATVYDVGNGKRRAEVYTGKVRFKNDKGNLVDYDNSLVENTTATSAEGNDVSEYTYRTKRSDKKSYFPNELSEDTPVMIEYEKYQVEITPQEMADGASAKVNEESIEDLYENEQVKTTSVDYEDSQDTTYRYESTTEGIKESIIVEDKNAPSKYNFTIALKNCCLLPQKAVMKGKINKEPKKIETGRGEDLLIYDIKEKTIVGGVPAAFMIDAAGTYSDDCGYEIQLVESVKEGKDITYQYDFQVKVDASYLQDKDTVYPVVIDPSFTWKDENTRGFSSAYVCSTAPNSNYTDSGTNILCVGARDSSKDVCRAYMRFEGINGLLEDSYVDSATLTLNTIQANAGMTVYVRQVASAWNSTKITYNNQPQREEKQIGSFQTNSYGEQIKVDLCAEMIDNYIRNDQTVYGFELTDSKDDSNTSSKYSAWIYNALSVNGARRPKLTVEYYDEPIEANIPHVEYKVYGASNGWSGYAQDGDKASRVEGISAFNLKMDVGEFNIGGIKYQCYNEGIGWSSWKTNENTVGDVETGKKMQSMRMYVCDDSVCAKISNMYDIYYRVYSKGKDWLGWAKNGEEAGDYTQGSLLTRVQIILVPRAEITPSRYTSSGKIEYGDVAEFSSRFPYSVGGGKNVTSLGCNFLDKEMSEHGNKCFYWKYQKNLFKLINNTFEDGYDSSFVSSVANPLIGFNMRLNSVALRQKYDVEHMASCINKDEETWMKDTVVSGDNEGDKPIEAVSMRLVPRGYKEGERACLSNHFVPSEDGFSFKNENDSFKRSEGSEIPKNRWIELYGEVAGPANYQAGVKEGYCFGMCMASILFYNKYIEYDDYVGGIDQNAKSAYRFCEQAGRKNNSLFKLIDYAHIAQHKGNKPTIDKEKEKGYEVILEKLKNNTSAKYVMPIGAGGQFGHALVPTGNVVTDVNGDYIIDVYDPNVPGAIQQAKITKDKKNFRYVYGSTYYYAYLVDVKAWVSQEESFFQKMWSEALKQ